MISAGQKQIQLPTYRGDCRRSYYRVDTRLPIRLEWLSKEDAASWLAEMNTPRGEGHRVEDLQLESRLSKIEAKIDLLLSRGGCDVDVPLESREKIPVQLSGAGLRVRVKGVFRIEDRVRVEMYLPGRQGELIRALGEVVSASGGRRGDRQGRISIMFRRIGDRERDAIVRHVYEVQRIVLRDRFEKDQSP